MRKLNLGIKLVVLSTILGLAGCNSGTSSSSGSTPSPSPAPTPSPSPNPTPSPTPAPFSAESGLFVLQFGQSVVTNGFDVATQPSQNNWQHYQSGTQGQINLLIANNITTLAVHGANISPAENQGILLGLNNNAQFNNLTSTQAQAIANLTAISAAGGDNGFVLTGTNTLSATELYYIGNNGIIKSISQYYNTSGIASSLSGVSFSSASYFAGKYYLYGAGIILVSNDGVIWNQSSAIPLAQFTNVLQVESNIFAALAQNGNIYLGSSPTSLTANSNVSATLISAAGGKLYSELLNGGTVNGYVYTPSATALRAPIDSLTIDFSSYVPISLSSMSIIDGVVYTTGASSQVSNNGSIVMATNPKNNQSMVVAVAGAPTGINMVSALQGSRLLIANSAAGVQSKILNNTLSPSSAHAGNLTQINALNFSNGQVDYSNLSSGKVNVEMMGFAGTVNNYMTMLIDGGIFVGESQIPATTIMDKTSGIPQPDTMWTLTSIDGHSFLATAFPTTSILPPPSAPGSGSLYFTNDNGKSWQQIPLSSLPQTSEQSTLAMTLGSTINNDGYYYIVTVDSLDTPALYQTKTPADLMSWQQIGFEAISNYVLIANGVIYQPEDGTTNVGIFDPLTGVSTIIPNALPQTFNWYGQSFPSVGRVTKNLAWNGQVFAEAQASSNYLWTNSSLTGPAATWKQNRVSFTGINQLELANETFNLQPDLVWTGKVWTAIGSLGGSGWGGNVYISNDGILWRIATVSNNLGELNAIAGIAMPF